ncbi:MAG TPA: hydantoinase/oxoprolinase family protein, partial [Dehalococcoidia bacterium]|nr:hydantoinase/oxoprolinase family protein [Dehalococcoidia bacterium]
MLRVGVDIGGTFTDITVLDDGTGEIYSDKILTTPQDPSLAVLDGLKQMGTDLRAVSLLVHGTTVAINALIEQKGARTGLITTKGFEDVLEIGRGNRTVFFDIFYQRPAPLAPRRWRLGVTERINSRGEVLEPLDLQEAAAALERLVDQGVQSVAVCLFNSFKNPVHERQLRELARSKYPDVDVSLSSEVLPEIREYERMSTTVTNGYLKPVIRAYLENLESSLAEMRGVGAAGNAPETARHAGLHVMQSN